MLKDEQSAVMCRSAKTAHTDDFSFEVRGRVDLRLDHEALGPPIGNAHNPFDGCAVEHRRDSRRKGKIEIDISSDHCPGCDRAIHHYDQDLESLLLVESFFLRHEYGKLAQPDAWDRHHHSFEILAERFNRFGEAEEQEEADTAPENVHRRYLSTVLRHQLMLPEKIADELVENHWVFQTARVTCSGNDLMHGTVNLLAHLTGTRQGAVEFAIKG